MDLYEALGVIEETMERFDLKLTEETWKVLEPHIDTLDFYVDQMAGHYVFDEDARHDHIQDAVEHILVTPKVDESLSMEELAQVILSSEAFMWLMAGSNHPDAQIKAIKPIYDRYIDAGGRIYRSSRA